MIMYAYSSGNSLATIHVYQQGRGFRIDTTIPLDDLRPDIATLLRVKARLSTDHVNVYLDDEGNIIDTPEVLNEPRHDPLHLLE